MPRVGNTTLNKSRRRRLSPRASVRWPSKAVDSSSNGLTHGYRQSSPNAKSRDALIAKPSPQHRRPWKAIVREKSASLGFTLIELLASSLLAAMLMLVIVGLMRTTNAQSKAARRALQANPPTSILADQIRRDFVNARHIEMRANRVRVSGYMAQDMRTGRQTFRPAEVTYAIVSNRQSTWLVRQETQFDQTIGKRSRLDVVWSGAATLEVLSFDDSEGESEFAAAPPGMAPMPAHLMIAIHNRDGESVFSEDIFHHHTVQ